MWFKKNVVGKPQYLYLKLHFSECIPLYQNSNHITILSSVLKNYGNTMSKSFSILKICFILPGEARIQKYISRKFWKKGKYIFLIKYNLFTQSEILWIFKTKPDEWGRTTLMKTLNNLTIKDRTDLIFTTATFDVHPIS